MDWLVNLEDQTSEGLEGTAKGPTFGDPLSAALTELDDEGRTFLSLTGDYHTLMISYLTGIVTPEGAEVLLCSVPAGDPSAGQAFGLRRESTGPRIITAGTGCSAELVVADGAKGAKTWPPTLQVGETWQVSVLQGDAEVAN